MTSYLESAAKSYGLDGTVEHDERYKIADEFLEVVYKLLEGSWEDDAVEANKQSGVFTNPNKVHHINHVGSVLFSARAHEVRLTISVNTSNAKDQTS